MLEATRPHIELYRAAMEERGLAASTIDHRLSTVCGFYRFAHIDGRISANPAQYVRRPKVEPSEGHGMDRAELGTFLFTAERLIVETDGGRWHSTPLRRLCDQERDRRVHVVPADIEVGQDLRIARRHRSRQAPGYEEDGVIGDPVRKPPLIEHAS